jgi:hypothetical protein
VLPSSTSLVGHVGTKDPSLAGKRSEILRKERIDVTAKLRKEQKEKEIWNIGINLEHKLKSH